jgi:muramoyltetrapeptide carboxypeptidase
MSLIRPPALRPGDCIGLVSPASRVADPTRIDRAVRYLEGLGYRTMVGKNALRLHGYLAGTDSERVADIHAMFADPEVKAIFCIRGGYGTPRLLPSIDYRLIRQNPKIFVGYSDITALHLAFWRKAELVSFHGSMAGVDMFEPMDPFTEELFWRILTSNVKLGRIPFPDPPTPLVPGKGTGRLLGGNLALVSAVVGTGYIPRFDDSILYLEDIGEDPYRVDRMLTQLRGAGILKRCAGIIIGHFTDCVPKDPAAPTFTTEEVIREYLVSAGRPTLLGVPFGHEKRNIPIPVGLRARVNGSEGTLEYLEGAVR